MSEPQKLEKCESCGQEKPGCKLWGNERIKLLLCPDCIAKGEEQFRAAKRQGRIRK